MDKEAICAALASLDEHVLRITDDELRTYLAFWTDLEERLEPLGDRWFLATAMARQERNVIRSMARNRGWSVD